MNTRSRILSGNGATRNVSLYDASMAAGLAEMRPGVNENDVAAAMMAAMIKAGCEFAGMEPFVTSGPRSGVAQTT